MEKIFLIYIDTFDPSSGGQVALHKLCHDIRSLGRDAYITCSQTHPQLNASRPTTSIEVENCVVIYPEIVHGNPLGAKHVVRWLLNTPGKCGGVGDGFYLHKKETDLIYKYSPFFEYIGDINGLLRCSFIDYDCFKNRHLVRDIDSCFLIKKGGMSIMMHDESSINFAQFQSNWDNASEILNRSKYFYCYDNECFWVTLAALCGCIPLVIPNTDISYEDWIKYFPFNSCGVAFGQRYINHARETLHLVESNCKEIQKNDLNGVSEMIKICDTL